MSIYHTYALDACHLLEECLDQLNDVILATAGANPVRQQQQRHGIMSLCNMRDALRESYNHLYEYIKAVIEKETDVFGPPPLTSSQCNGEESAYDDDPKSLISMAKTLKSIIDHNHQQRQWHYRQRQLQHQQQKQQRQQPQGEPTHQEDEQESPRRNSTGSIEDYQQEQHRPQIQRQTNVWTRGRPSMTGTSTMTTTTSHNNGSFGDVTLSPPHQRTISCTRTSSSSSTNTAIDSLLFRLTVMLQLCIVRIDDARVVLIGRRLRHADSECCSLYWNAGILFGMSLATSTYISSNYHNWNLERLNRFVMMGNKNPRNDSKTITTAAAQIGLTAVVLYWINRKWSILWMSNKLYHSTDEINDWNQQWRILVNAFSEAKQLPTFIDICTKTKYDDVDDSSARTQRLIDYTLRNLSKHSFWHSQGELRFVMLKRAMDVFYASVGTAVDYTGSKNIDTDKITKTTMATAAAASFYYSLTGASRRSAEVTSSTKSARDVIQNAWGMVSLPGLKQLSLQASRILKGAAVADRIQIAGVYCFVLSADPSPELAAAIARSQRLAQQPALHKSSSNHVIQRLSTINEESGDEEHEEDEADSMSASTSSKQNAASCKPFARCPRSYRQRDVILHLTGGGFFAHIIASDLPYLLDWSAATGAVVICPEYALLPKHTFPVALEQVEKVYETLVGTTNKDSENHKLASTRLTAQSILGFEVNQIAVTGESAGGNLAAALCVKLGMKSNDRLRFDGISKRDSRLNDAMSHDITADEHPIAASAPPCYRMPDALMLSCPVLNLSLEMSHSRAIGSNDPVLPSGLISAISDAYLPCEQLGINKKYPLASPIYASDDILCQFPPTLLFASSTDPLLDDSVVFNQRLRYVGVESELFAAQNLPHAYLGLGTAGFPEAQQVQEHCVLWLNRQLNRDMYQKHSSIKLSSKFCL